MSKIFEVELRSTFDQATHERLTTFLSKQATDKGADDKRMWFFLVPGRHLKITHNISRKSGKVSIKSDPIGTSSTTQEVEYFIDENDVKKAVELFVLMGYEYLFEPIVSRHDFLYKDVDISLKYSKTWGYHAEFEVVVDSAEKQEWAESVILAVCQELGVKVLSDAETKAISDSIVSTYVNPVEGDLFLEG